MARASRTLELNVWMNGEPVGHWTVRGADHSFRYAEHWLESKNRRQLSLSLPLTPTNAPFRTQQVQPFFENLLPDSDEIRRRMAQHFGAASTSAFDLLVQVGRDCVGAVQLLSPDSPPPDVRQIKGRPATDAQMAVALSRVRGPTLGAQEPDDFRLSLAGAQAKTAFLFHNGRWCIPEGTTPSTHIFKLPMLASRAGAPDLSASVENEWLCAQLLPLLGIPCAPCEMRTFQGERVLIVQRFDRQPAANGKWIIRKPQEDLCQALAVPPTQKYEQQGGPGIEEILRLLRASRRAKQDREDFFRTQLAFWLLCAIDGHAKNFSLFLEAQNEFTLTPRYDVISAYPLLGRRHDQLPIQKVKMAMAVEGESRRHHRWKEMRTHHWVEMGRRHGVAGARLILEELIEKTGPATEAARARLPRGFPESVAEPIFQGLSAAARRAGEELVGSGLR